MATTSYPSSKQVIPTYAGTALQGDIDHADWHDLTNKTVQAIEDVLGTTAGTSVLKNVQVGQFVATLSGTETLTNKRLTSPKINEDVALTATATELNLLHEKLGAWTSWDPTIANLTLGTGGTKSGAYCQIGKIVLFRFGFTLGSASFSVGGLSVTLPVTIKSGSLGSYTDIGFGNAFNGATTFPVSVTNGGLVYCRNASGTYLYNAAISSTAPFTWGAGNTLYIEGFYEVE